MAEKKTADPGLLFYLSGETPEADYAKGEKQPTHFEKVELVSGGVDKGKYLQCDNHQLIAYRAPGNIYAERGTLSFFWRSRIPMGFTPFPVFRVSFADHASWDQVFLRIDYNGQQQGFDAFVTDVNSTRIRVSSTMHPALKQMEWVHIAFAWDENVGVKLYLNGVLAEYRLDRRVLFAALDQFGPHSRIIANWGVQSSYNFVRGGDLDEVRIYDRMLSDENIAALSKLQPLENVPCAERSLDCPVVRAEWNKRYGWDKPEAQPNYYEGSVSARKVMPKDAFEHGLWSYKTMDGIRETAWPNMFNRS
ncbi:MAG: LamG domain-containing protein, partial [Lachnospiraceae bacterium]|nr:LamG domain-containing protein [Lachnospiraceae bacterium]